MPSAEPGTSSKKRPRPSEHDRPDVCAKRRAFRAWVSTIDPKRLVTLDEAGINIAMGRSHAWVPRGEEYVEARPMHWGDNLTLIGAIRPTGWVTLGTCWRAVTTVTFVHGVRTRLAPRLRHGDVVLLDHLQAHKAPAVQRLIERRGATVQFLPPYSHACHPIEPAWSFVKRRIRAHAPRTAGTRFQVSADNAGRTE